MQIALKSHIDMSREPYQTFGKVIDLRNWWLHYKKPFERARITAGCSISWIEAKMSASFIETLPERVRQLITEICTSMNCTVPTWTQSGPGWEV